MHNDLKPGLRHVQKLRVSEALTVPAMAPIFASFADMPPTLPEDGAGDCSAY